MQGGNVNAGPDDAGLRCRSFSPLCHSDEREQPSGLAPDAEEECSAELVEWADIIFVMEKAHRTKLKRRFGAHLKRARVICLDIPDDYSFMQPELVALLERKVGSVLK